MRILHVAIFNEERCGESFYAIDYKLNRALTELGHFVLPFSYRDVARRANLLRVKKLGIREMNRRLIKTAENFAPDMLLIGKGELIKPETIARIRELLPNIKVGLWTCDALYDIEDHFAAISPQVDAIFSTMTGAMVRRMEQAGGTPYFFFPNPVDPAVEWPRDEAEPTGPSLLWIGGVVDEPERQALINWVDGFEGSALYACLGRPKVRGAEYLRLLGQAKIVTGFSRFPDVPWYTSDRLSHAMGRGAFYLTRYFEGVEDFFERGVHCDWFHTVEEADELARHYLSDAPLRNRIAKAGRERIFELFAHTHVAQHMLDVVFDGNDSRYRVPENRAHQGPAYLDPLVRVR